MKFTLIIDKEKEEEVLVTAHAPSALTDRIQALVQADGTDFLYAYTDDEIIRLPFSSIECITVLDGKTIAIDTHATHYRLKQRLYEVESILPPCFLRINKSTLANESKLARFRTTFSGAVDAVFCCGHTDYVSRRCFAQIKRRFHI